MTRRDEQETVRTVAPWGDEATVTRLRQELFDAETERAVRVKACTAAAAAYQEANQRFIDAKAALLDHLGIVR